MSSRVHPRNPRAFNLYYLDNLIVSESNASFLINATDQAEKILLMQKYIQKLFGHTSVLPLDLSTVTDSLEWYLFRRDYFFFIRN